MFIKNAIYLILFYSAVCNGQTTAFDAMIDSTLQKTVSFITSDNLLYNYEDYTILDSREINEYNVSHLKNAIHVGYEHFNMDKTIKKLSLKTPVIVYCSVGYRSEKIAEKLIKKGYKVYNLYGGIFEWKNKKNMVIDTSNTETNKVHCYNENWSKWLVNGEKIYD
ncbi:MAG: rhodanese-like domain-containing protein [Flavobacteriaceae bacterium]